MFGTKFRVKVLSVLHNAFSLDLIMDMSAWRLYYKEPIAQLTKKYHKQLLGNEYDVAVAFIIEASKGNFPVQSFVNPKSHLEQALKIVTMAKNQDLLEERLRTLLDSSSSSTNSLNSSDKTSARMKNFNMKFKSLGGADADIIPQVKIKNLSDFQQEVVLILSEKFDWIVLKHPETVVLSLYTDLLNKTEKTWSVMGNPYDAVTDFVDEYVSVAWDSCSTKAEVVELGEMVRTAEKLKDKVSMSEEDFDETIKESMRWVLAANEQL